MSGLTQDGTTEPAPRDHFLRRRERRQRKHHFLLLFDHEQEWQTYLVHPYSPECADHTYTSVWLLLPFFATISRKLKEVFISPEEVMWYEVLAFLGFDTIRS